MSVETRAYKGYQMICVTFGAGATVEQMTADFDEYVYLARHTLDMKLGLLDFTGTSVDSAFMEHVKSQGKSTQDYIKRAALLGVTDLKKILLRGYLQATGQGDIVKAFSSEADALAWLTE